MLRKFFKLMSGKFHVFGLPSFIYVIGLFIYLPIYVFFLIASSFGKAYHLRGILYHGMGRHRSAIKDLSVALKHESSNIECLYLRASCHHAIGEYKAAVCYCLI
jgi:tetratricopeptide (TPR) repeat protein